MASAEIIPAGSRALHRSPRVEPNQNGATAVPRPNAPPLIMHVHKSEILVDGLPAATAIEDARVPRKCDVGGVGADHR